MSGIFGSPGMAGGSPKHNLWFSFPIELHIVPLSWTKRTSNHVITML